MSKLKLLFVVLAVGASATVSIAIRHAENTSLNERRETLRRQSEALAALAAENERLTNHLQQPRRSHALSRAEQAELLQLRGQMGSLRHAATEKAGLQATNDAMRAVAEAAAQTLAAAQALPNYWPKEQLAFAGYDTPESTTKSLLWAMCYGNVESWRECCDPKVVADIEAEAKRHGVSEAEMDAQMKEDARTLTDPSVGFHIVSQTNPSPDRAVVQLAFDGEGAVRNLVLTRVGNEWKFRDLKPVDEPIAAK